MELRKDFIKEYDNVIQPLLQNAAELGSVSHRLEEILRYNTLGGKMNRGCAVVRTTHLLAGNDNNLTFQATVLGWCVEILQAFMLVADDIMDKSEKRRGKPCWYKHPDVGLVAINDAFLLESSVFALLKHHIGTETCYVKCLELFLQVIRLTEFGQALDLESETLEIDSYTRERYDAIVTHKTSYYSFYLPVVLALHLCGRDSDQELECAKRLLLKIGHYFQVQDDYLDCYGDPEVIGKIGSDIQERKCSWLFLTALESVTEDTRKELISLYGKAGDENVAAVKRIYEDSNLEQKFLEYSDKSYAELCDEIKSSASVLPAKIFQDFLDEIHARSK